MPPRFLQVGDVHDQGIEQGTSLGGENGGNRLAVGGVGTQAVDSLGREGEEPAIAEGTSGLLYAPMSRARFYPTISWVWWHACRPLDPEAAATAPRRAARPVRVRQSRHR